MSNILDMVLHIFFPNKCILCRNPMTYDGIICEKCVKSAPFINSDVCLLCNKSVCVCNLERNHFDKLISAFYYKQNLDNAIIDLKFNNVRVNAKKLAWYMADCLDNVEADVVIPTPLYKKDLLIRGFNQSELLAKWVCHYSKIPFATNVLVKLRQTPKQHNLNANKRKKNLMDAFGIINEHIIKGKTVILVDDVYTTGSTMRECSRILKVHGAKEIICLTAAKTESQKDTPPKNVYRFYKGFGKDFKRKKLTNIQSVDN